MPVIVAGEEHGGRDEPHDQQGGRDRDHRGGDRRRSRGALDPARRTDGRDRDGRQGEPDDAPGEERQDGLEHGFRSDRGASPASHRQHTDLDAARHQDEHPGGRDDGERDAQSGDEQDQERTLHGDEALVDASDDLAGQGGVGHLARGTEELDAVAVDEDVTAATEEPEQLGVLRAHVRLEPVGEPREVPRLIQRQRWIGRRGRHQGERPLGVAEARPEIQQLRPVDQDRLRREGALVAGTDRIDVVGPGPPVPRSRLGVQRAIDAVQGHGLVVSVDREFEFVARTQARPASQQVRQPHARTVGAGEDLDVVEDVRAGEQPALDLSRRGGAPAGQGDVHRRSQDLLLRGFQLRTLGGAFGEGGGSLVDQ